MILGLIGLIPALAIVVFVYLKDPSERKPLAQVVAALAVGVAVACAAIAVGLTMQAVLQPILPEVVYLILNALIVAAAVEEILKYLGLRWFCRRRTLVRVYDAMVWGCIIGFGFAAIENCIYLLNGNALTAALRSVFAVPGHVAYGIVMGYYVGLALKARAMGDEKRAKGNNVKAILVPFAVHGVYDVLILRIFDLWWLAFILVLAFVVYSIVLAMRQSRVALVIAPPPVA